MKRLVLVLLVLVALMGIASADCAAGNSAACDLPDYAQFKMTSEVQGDGLVVADRYVKLFSPDDFCADPDECCVDPFGNPGQQLKMHTHGSGSYQEMSDVNYMLDDNEATLTFNDSATMMLAAAAVPTQAVNVEWKEDICLKDYQVGAAMRERYYAAESVQKNTKGGITSVASTASVTGYGEIWMNTDSSFTGWGHFGVLATNKETDFVDVDEDYFGTYQMKKSAYMKVPKAPACPPTPPEDWLPCGNPTEWAQEIVSKCPSCPNVADW